MERFLDYFVPEKYVLQLKFQVKQKMFFGSAVITGLVKAETIKFHAVRLKIKSVLVNSEEVKYKVEDDALIISNMKSGEAEIQIAYEGVLNENMEGVYLSTYEYEGKTETIIATQFESHYARQAFPCVDEPAAKAVFELSMEMSEKFDGIMLSNMPAKIADGNVYEFEPTPKMSTYLLAFVIGKLQGKTIKNKHGVEITTYCSLAQDIDAVDFANEIAARSLEFYDDNFGVSYPLKRCVQVALPDFDAGAMENWGLVTYRESMLLASKKATLGTKKSVALTVAHELSHQWFGDLVTMEWWDDLWLNESFASVMEYYAVDFIHPEYKIFESFFVGDCYAALLRDAYTGVQSVHQDVKSPEEISTLFDSAIVYAKGARLMLMLIRLMGWNEFCKGLKDYFEKFQYKNTIGDDLWKALEPYADFSPKKLMHAFIDKPGYPVIKNESESFKKFSQKKFSLDGAEMEKSDWPLPKITEDMSGHYVLDLDEKEFKERLERFSELGLEEKIRLLIDRDLLTKSGLASAKSLVPLALEFKNDNSASVWNKIAGLVGNLKMYFDDDSEEEKLLKKYVLKLVNEKLEEVGMVTRRDDDENMLRLRANLMGLDYYAEDEKRLKELAEMYNDDYEKMDAEIREDILVAKIYFQPEMIEKYIEKYKEIADPDVKFDYLVAVTCIKDKKWIGKALGLLGDLEIVKPQDQLYLFVWLYRNPKMREQAFKWLMEHWEEVKKMSGEKSLDNYPTYIARLARTEEELKCFEEFFGPMKENLLMKRAIMIGEREIRARLKLIQRDKAEVLTALKAYC
ncbi:M1 family metallopeptidase [Candidatus Saccharibacteria bacterium]|nr:M1 family metallopeptidase [Candidatus Saccharibacteria bacterium]